MIYYLKHFDTKLVRFFADEKSNDPKFELLWITDEHRALLPLDLELSPEGLGKWLKRRSIPKNRAYVQAFLSKCGLSINRTMNIISISKGLSLNDCYWITEENFDGRFSDYNLYENNFSRILSMIAFTGYGSSIRSSVASSPEFTTNGMLPKCWRRERGVISLWKGGTTGASNTGYEPYSEYLAFQIADAMGIDAVPYEFHKWKGRLCSKCNLFTSIDHAFMPVGRIVTDGGIDAVEAYYQSLGSDFTEALYDMYLFDAIICNTDRHFGNFGFIVDSKTNKILKPAPLFDHGNSLFNLAGLDDFDSPETLEKYASALLPRIYDDFNRYALKTLNPRRKAALRKVIGLKLKNTSRYQLPAHRLAAIEAVVKKRVEGLLG